MYKPKNTYCVNIFEISVKTFSPTQLFLSVFEHLQTENSDNMLTFSGSSLKHSRQYTIIFEHLQLKTLHIM